MKHLFKFICCGSVDDGKSTLIGRLLMDSGNVKKDQLEDALKASRRNGSDRLEPAMLLDGLLAEREQQITIDIAHRYFDYDDIRFHILDCPGHKQYTHNMAIAAAQANAAVVVIDATKGISEQTRRHLDLCAAFRIQKLCVALTKCDLATDCQKADLIERRLGEITLFLDTYPFEHTVLPVSAMTGENMDAVLKTLVRFARETAAIKADDDTSILHVQTARMHQGCRYIYTHPVCGADVVRDKAAYRVWPQNTPVTVKGNPLTHGCFEICEQVDIQHGDCLTNRPVFVASDIHQKTVWFQETANPLLIRAGTRVARVKHMTNDMLYADKELVFNNIEDIKENGFGLLIDEMTKETVGCVLFTGNRSDMGNNVPKTDNTLSVLKRHSLKIGNCLPKNKQQISDFCADKAVLNKKALKETVFFGITDHLDERMNALLALLRAQGVNADWGD